jgi:hypothetical protein
MTTALEGGERSVSRPSHYKATLNGRKMGDAWGPSNKVMFFLELEEL